MTRDEFEEEACNRGEANFKGMRRAWPHSPESLRDSYYTEAKFSVLLDRINELESRLRQLEPGNL